MTPSGNRPLISSGRSESDEMSSDLDPDSPAPDDEKKEKKNKHSPKGRLSVKKAEIRVVSRNTLLEV